MIEIEFLTVALRQYFNPLSLVTKSQIMIILLEFKSYDNDNDGETTFIVNEKIYSLSVKELEKRMEENKLSDYETAKLQILIKKYKEIYSFYIKCFDLQI